MGNNYTWTIKKRWKGRSRHTTGHLCPALALSPGPAHLVYQVSPRKPWKRKEIYCAWGLLSSKMSKRSACCASNRLQKRSIQALFRFWASSTCPNSMTTALFPLLLAQYLANWPSKSKQCIQLQILNPKVKKGFDWIYLKISAVIKLHL